MCRLALINNVGIRHIEENYGLENLFNYLERQLGGHGNGCCIIHNDGSYYIDKGVALSNNTIVREILNDIDNIKWIIYHTRLASVGTVSTKNCHPFEHDDKVLAMNGTERQYKVVNRDLTDTENILLTTENIRVDTRQYRSVFLGYENGRVFANKNCGSLKYIPCANGGKIFASNFPEEYYNNDTVYEAPQIFVEGKKMKPLSLVVNHHYTKGYRDGYGKGWRDGYGKGWRDGYHTREVIHDEYYYMGLR